MKLSKLPRAFVYQTLLFLLISSSAFGDVGGQITGVVRDPTGDGVAGATVTITNLGTGQKQATTADEHGLYSFPVLAVGQYEIEINPIAKRD
jgi:Carboxypeptidase regulatory-like domain